MLFQVADIMGNSASQVNSRTATPIVVQPTVDAVDNLHLTPTHAYNEPSPQHQPMTINGTAHLKPVSRPVTPSVSPVPNSPRLPDMLVPPVDGMAMLSGVPFKLSLALDTNSLARFSGYNSLISEPLIDKYEYNFDLERSVKNS